MHGGRDGSGCRRNTAGLKSRCVQGGVRRKSSDGAAQGAEIPTSWLHDAVRGSYRRRGRGALIKRWKIARGRPVATVGLDHIRGSEGSWPALDEAVRRDTVNGAPHRHRRSRSRRCGYRAMTLSIAADCLHGTSRIATGGRRQSFSAIDALREAGIFDRQTGNLRSDTSAQGAGTRCSARFHAAGDAPNLRKCGPRPEAGRE